MKNKLLLIPCLIINLLIPVTSIFAEPAAEKPKPSPEFNLTLLGTKQRVSLKELITQNNTRNVVLLSFFSTTCEPCKKEIPELHKLAEEYKGKSVKIYLISVDGLQADKVQEYVNEYKITLPVLLDPYGMQTGKNYNVVNNNIASVPKLYVITKNGYKAKLFDGYKEENLDILKKIINESLSEEARPFEVEQNFVTILFSNSTNGYFKSCDCPSHPFGGITRRATYINGLRKANKNILLVDTGDLFSAYGSEIQGKYLLKCMEAINYDVMAVGDQELLIGLDKFKKLMAGTPGIDFLSSNFNYCTTANNQPEQCFTLTKPYIIKQVGKYKVGIISVISPKCFVFYPKDKKQGFKITDPVDTIKGFIENFRKEVDLIVLLSHSGIDEDKKIVQQVPSGIDVIVGGHSQTLLKDPDIQNNVIIVQAGEKGQYLGSLTIFFGSNKKIKSHQHELIALTKEIADDPEILDIMKQYNDEQSKSTGSIVK